MISNKAILNTMTSIRLAGEVSNYLSKEAWEQFRDRTESLYTSTRRKLRTSTELAGNQKKGTEKSPSQDVRRYGSQ
jgi:hypothetical protein